MSLLTQLARQQRDEADQDVSYSRFVLRLLLTTGKIVEFERESVKACQRFLDLRVAGGEPPLEADIAQVDYRRDHQHPHHLIDTYTPWRLHYLLEWSLEAGEWVEADHQPDTDV